MAFESNRPGHIGDMIRPTGENKAYEAIYPYLPYLLGGGLTGAIGGALTGDEDSSTLGRMLTGGLLGAGAGAGLGYAGERLADRGSLMDYLNPAESTWDYTKRMAGDAYDAAGAGLGAAGRGIAAAGRGIGKAYGNAQDFYGDLAERIATSGENERGARLDAQRAAMKTPAGKKQLEARAAATPGTNAWKRRRSAVHQNSVNANPAVADAQFSDTELQGSTPDTQVPIKQSACSMLLGLAR